MRLQTVTRLIMTKDEYEKIVTFSPDEAMEAVEKNGNALRYVDPKLVIVE